MPTLQPAAPRRSRRWPGALVIVGAGAVLAAFFINGGRPIQNSERTRADHPEIKLRTRRYHDDINLVHKTVRETVIALRTYGRAWKIKSDDGENIHVKVPVLVFTDDMVITMRASNDKVLLDVRSTARVGRGDFGENRRHVLQLLDALDGKLKAT